MKMATNSQKRAKTLQIILNHLEKIEKKIKQKERKKGKIVKKFKKKQNGSKN